MKLLRCLALATTVAGAAPALAWDGLVVFGDSLSDTGNFAALNGGLYPSPAFDYAPGRFSNGPVAVEYLSAWLALPMDNRAFGGARTGPPVGGGSENYAEDTPEGALLALLLGKPYGWLNGTGLTSQVDSYVAGGSTGADKLYFVWAGANDYFLPSALATPEAAAATVNNALANVQTALVDLYQAGARDFMVPNMADLGLTPSFLEEGPLAASFATLVSTQHNAGLALMLGQLDAALPEANFYTPDVFGMLQAAASNPGLYGFSNVEAACQDVPGCIDDPAGYLFWDGVHITSAGHQAVAGAFVAALVPEADTWAMLLAGLGLLGVARRLQARCARGDTAALQGAIQTTTLVSAITAAPITIEEGDAQCRT